MKTELPDVEFKRQCRLADLEIDAEISRQKRELTRLRNVASRQEAVANDKEISAKLNQELKQTLANIKQYRKIYKPRKSKKHGRPKGGRMVFTKSAINALPEVGYLCEIARALGVKRISVQQWTELKKNPVPSVTDKGHVMLVKKVLVRWLIATERLKSDWNS